uniref:glycosyltransferase family 2 protein n=1 Tax=Methanobrevibacter sp. TaxID=66852 RepID=UPI003864C4B3
MCDVSVIIPVYNVEKYLKECLDSVCNQTLANIEIICVNDGSTDNSLAILNEYAQKDGRIKIISQENQGLGAARNRGLEDASADYVYFLDSDDYIELTTLEKLFNNAVSNSSDVVLFKF